MFFAVSTWIGRITNPIAFFVVLYLIRTETYKRKHHKIEEPKALQFFAILTLFTCEFWYLISIAIYIPYVCEYGAQLIGAAFILTKSCLTFYQIARLQFCFSSSSQQQIGYSNWVFKLLYINGIVFVIYSSIAAFMLTTSIPLQNYGCYSIAKKDKYGIISILFLWYYCWDWIVLFMYIIKIIQIKSRVSDNKALERIDKILKKVLFLTLLYEMFVFIAAIIVFYNDHDLAIGTVIFRVFDGLVMAFVIYLMIEHNNEKYDKFIHIFKLICKLKCIDKMENKKGTVKDEENQQNTQQHMETNENIEQENNDQNQVNEIEIE
eukprot:368637_1